MPTPKNNTFKFINTALKYYLFSVWIRYVVVWCSLAILTSFPFLSPQSWFCQICYMLHNYSDSTFKRDNTYMTAYQKEVILTKLSNSVIPLTCIDLSMAFTRLLKYQKYFTSFFLGVISLTRRGKKRKRNTRSRKKFIFNKNKSRNGSIRVAVKADTKLYLSYKNGQFCYCCNIGTTQLYTVEMVLKVINIMSHSM